MSVSSSLREAGDLVSTSAAVSEMLIAAAAVIVALTGAVLVARGAMKQLTIKTGNLEATMSTTAQAVETVAYQVQRNGGSSLADKVHETHRQLGDVVGALNVLTRRLEELGQAQSEHVEEMRAYRLVTNEALSSVVNRCHAFHDVEPNEGVL